MSVKSDGSFGAPNTGAPGSDAIGAVRSVTVAIAGLSACFALLVLLVVFTAYAIRDTAGERADPADGAVTVASESRG